MIKIWFLLFLFKKIYSISGTEGERYNTNGDITEPLVNLYEICPCDKTAGVCDHGCCCDKDCIQYMIDNDYYEQYPECDPSSYASRNINSKLEYCYEYKKSLDDLYNPLVLAFKILKRGFCLYKDNSNNDDNDSNNDIDNNNNDNNQIDLNTDIFEKVIGNDGDDNNSPFEKIKNQMAPIALPSGLCLFDSYPIKFLEDYEVTCSYLQDQSETIFGNITNEFRNIERFLINQYNEVQNLNESVNCVIKKIEIIYYLNDGPRLFLYYENRNGEEFRDLTYIVKFLGSRNDYTKSGNPGYIKGKPLLIGQKERSNGNNQLYKNGAVFPIYYEGHNYDINNQFFYNNYFDNKITFEDFIIYGYQQRLHNIIIQLFKNDNGIISYIVGKHGNANVNYTNDWVEIGHNNVDGRIYLLTGKYRYVGAVNNPQIKIDSLNVDPVNYDQGSLYYFILKFYKKNIETKWWYAPGPGFFKLPRNVMYPFRIGTTQYSTS